MVENPFTELNRKIEDKALRIISGTDSLSITEAIENISEEAGGGGIIIIDSAQPTIVDALRKDMQDFFSDSEIDDRLAKRTTCFHCKSRKGIKFEWMPQTMKKEAICSRCLQAKKTSLTIRLPGERIARNDLCHCGSGKKYKKCCLKKSVGETRKNVQL